MKCPKCDAPLHAWHEDGREGFECETCDYRETIQDVYEERDRLKAEVADLRELRRLAYEWERLRSPRTISELLAHIQDMRERET